MTATARAPLARLLWLSVAAAVATIALKTLAWALTGSVGLLSDAAESMVNLAAALFALVIVRWAARPPDDLREALQPATIFTHLEPLEDPASFADTQLDRSAADAERRR